MENKVKKRYAEIYLLEVIAMFLVVEYHCGSGYSFNILSDDSILTSKGVEQQTYRSCMGFLKLAEKCSDALLEAACKKAISYTASPSYKSVKNIFVTSSEKLVSETTDTKTTHKAHGITRGVDYYRR